MTGRVAQSYLEQLLSDSARGTRVPDADEPQGADAQALSAHARQRLLVGASLLMLPGRDKPTARRWA